MGKPHFTKDVINRALSLIGQANEDGVALKAVVMGSRLKHQLVQIARDSNWSDPHFAVQKLVGMTIVTCKGITGPEVFFFQSLNDARNLRDSINEKVAMGYSWPQILAIVEHINRYDRSQFESGRIIEMEDFSNVQEKAKEQS